MSSRPDPSSSSGPGADEAPRRPRLRVRGVSVAALYALLFAVWLIASKWIVPELIRWAYAGSTFGLLDGLITGQASHPLQHYLADWSALAGQVTGLLASAGVIVLFSAALSEALTAVGAHNDGEPRDAGKTRTERESLGSVLLLAIAWGLVAGFAEAAYFMNRYLLGSWIPAGDAATVDYVWMIPAAYAAALVAIGLLFGVARRAWRRIGRLRHAATLFSFVALFGLLRGMSERVELYAAVLLAAGLAAQVGRMLRGHERELRAVLRRAVPVVSGAWLLVIGVVVGGQWLEERQRLASLPPADPEAPNVLLIILDTVRAANLSLYGYERPTTPFLEELGASGVVFDSAMAPSPWTLPTHASVFTGRLPHELSTDWMSPLDDAEPTVAEYLGSRGYVSRAFVANFYYGGGQFGLGRGFIRYDDQPRSWRMVLRSTWLTRSAVERARKALGLHGDFERKTADRVNRAFLEWLDRAPDRPFFVFLNYFDAHSPYLPPPPWRTRFTEDPPRYWIGSDDATEHSSEVISELRDAYDGSLAYLDDRLGRLFAGLRDRGVLENTLVVITSDHGEEFGEHGLMFHGHSLYLPAVHVPLLATWAGHLPPGVRVGAPVSLVDVPSTIVDLIGADAGSPFPGRSLAGLASSRGPTGGRARGAEAERPVLSLVTRNPRTPSHYPVHRGDIKALVVDRWRYILNGDGREELYDLAADPGERVDLSATVRGETVVPELRGRLRELLGGEGADRSASRR